MPRAPTTTDQGEVELSSLKALRVTGQLPGSLLGNRLQAPELEILTASLLDYRNSGLDIAPGLLSGVARYPGLKSVCLGPVSNVTPEQLSNFLIMHPSLETVRLQHITNDSSGSDLLARLEASRRPTHNLKHLIVEFALSRNVRVPSAGAAPVGFRPPENYLSRSADIILRIFGCVGMTDDSPDLRISIYAEAQSGDFGEQVVHHPRVEFVASISEITMPNFMNI